MSTAIIPSDNQPTMFQEPDVDVLFESLPDKHKAFVAAYVGSARFSQTEAMIAAGYSPHSAARGSWRIANNQDVRACIRGILKSRLLSDEAILDELGAVAMAPMHMHRTVINEYTDSSGKHVQVIREDLTGKVKALEILAKAAGLLTDRVSVDVKHTKTVVGISIEEVVSKRVAPTTDTEH